MKFSEAMKLLEDGYAVRRKQWQEKCYIIISKINDHPIVEWVNANHASGNFNGIYDASGWDDMLAEDWEYYEI